MLKLKFNEMFGLYNKNILLTGATGHLGKSIALALASAGANVIVNSRSEEKCSLIVNELRYKGLKAESAVFDVTDKEAISNYFSEKRDFPLHCLINNAYLGGAGTIKSSESIDYLASYNLILVSTHNLMRHALGNLRRAVENSGDASVINIASMYGQVSPDLRIYSSEKKSNPPFYGAAKAALLQWTRYAACEFGPEKIRINAISPGAFPSISVQNESPEFIEKLNGKIPLGRIGQAQELTGVVIMLASQAASYITGTNISVDGGWTAW